MGSQVLAGQLPRYQRQGKSTLNEIREDIAPLQQIAYGVYGDVSIIYPKHLKAIFYLI